MTSQNPPDVSLKRIIIGAACGGLVSYALTQLSLHGVSFEEFGVNSEIIKGAITTTVTAYALAPILIIYKMRDIILWFWEARSILKDALKGVKSYINPN